MKYLFVFFLFYIEIVQVFAVEKKVPTVVPPVNLKELIQKFGGSNHNTPREDTPHGNDSPKNRRPSITTPRNEWPESEREKKNSKDSLILGELPNIYYPHIQQRNDDSRRSRANSLVSPRSESFNELNNIQYDREEHLRHFINLTNCPSGTNVKEISSHFNKLNELCNLKVFTSTNNLANYNDLPTLERNLRNFLNKLTSIESDHEFMTMNTSLTRQLHNFAADFKNLLFAEKAHDNLFLFLEFLTKNSNEYLTIFPIPMIEQIFKPQLLILAQRYFSDDKKNNLNLLKDYEKFLNINTNIINNESIQKILEDKTSRYLEQDGEQVEKLDFFLSITSNKNLKHLFIQKQKLLTQSFNNVAEPFFNDDNQSNTKKLEIYEKIFNGPLEESLTHFSKKEKKFYSSKIIQILIDIFSEKNLELGDSRYNQALKILHSLPEKLLVSNENLLNSIFQFYKKKITYDLTERKNQIALKDILLLETKITKTKRPIPFLAKLSFQYLRNTFSINKKNKNSKQETFSSFFDSHFPKDSEYKETWIEIFAKEIENISIKKFGVASRMREWDVFIKEIPSFFTKTIQDHLKILKEAAIFEFTHQEDISDRDKKIRSEIDVLQTKIEVKIRSISQFLDKASSLEREYYNNLVKLDHDLKLLKETREPIFYNFENILETLESLNKSDLSIDKMSHLKKN